MPKNLRQKYEICQKRVIFAPKLFRLFLMRKKLVAISLFIALLAPPALLAQTEGAWRVRHLTADSISLKIDTLSIIPESFQIQDVSPYQYRLDPLTSTITILDSNLLGRRLFLQYKVFPNDFSRPVAHRSTASIEPHRNTHQTIVPPSPSIRDVLNDNLLYTNGAISRGVSVGNSQDLVLNSALNLQISGKLSEDVEILASVSDKNIPVQPEGNTQTLQDISSIFISLKIKEMTKLDAGDVVWTMADDNFLRVSRNMLGLDAKVKYQPSEKMRVLNEVGGGMAKGRFARQTLVVQNGVQGPYKLYGADGEVSIMMIAGSERVYIDGQLMIRGAENDYTIDYNTAELTFTPKMLVTAEKRVIVEFEYSNRHYSRYNLFTHNELEISKKLPLKLYVNLFHEQDLKNHSIQPELTVENMRFLAGLGDAGGTAFFPYFDTAAYTPERIQYEKIDTLYKNKIYTIYKYSTNSQATLYNPDFTYMGSGKGNYKLVSSTANGRVFAWVAPVDDVAQGDYEPVLTLTSPISQSMATVGLDFAARENTRIQTEVALSHYDKNTFSKKDRNDDIGFAYFLDVRDIESFASRRDSLPWKMESHAQLQFLHKNFTPFESFREVEFARQYNLTEDYATNRSEWMAQAGIALSKPGRHLLQYDLNYFNRGNETHALRNELKTDDRWSDWRLQSGTSFLASRDTVQKSRYTVSRIQLSKIWKPLTLNINNLLEYNLLRNTSNDSLRLNSFAFNELNAAVQSADKAKHQFLLGYKNRIEMAPDSIRLRHHLTIHEVRAQYRFAQIKNQSFSLNATYRHQSLKDSVGKTVGEHYFVGNVQYTGRFLRNALIINTYYETGSGMELKKTFTFIKVAKGQGTHVWNDYNGNGIEELDEFEVAAFPDEAEYVKVWIAGTDYVNVWQSQWTQSLQLRPAAVWSSKQGFRKFLSRFSDVLTLNSALKHKTKMFTPFSRDDNDTNLVAKRLNLTNTFSFNNSSSPFAFDFIVQKNSNTQCLYYGLETNTVDLQKLALKSTPVEPLYLQTTLEHSNTRNSSNCFTSRQYLVETWSAEEEIRLQFQNRYTAAVKGLYAHKVNHQGSERVQHLNAELSFEYRMPTRGTVSLTTEYVYMKGDIGQNSTVSYYMLEGLNLGQNLLWTLSGQISITQFLQVAVQYHGRAMQGHAVIHTGTVTLNAVF